MSSGQIRVRSGAYPALVVWDYATAEYTPTGSELGYRIEIYDDSDVEVYGLNYDTSVCVEGIITIPIPANVLAPGDYTVNLFARLAGGNSGAGAVAPFTIPA